MNKQEVKQEVQPKVLDLTSTLTNDAVLIPRNVLDNLINNLNIQDFNTIKRRMVQEINACTNIKAYKELITTEAEFRNVIDKYEEVLEKEVLENVTEEVPERSAKVAEPWKLRE